MDYTEYDTRLAAYAVVTDQDPERPRVLLALWNEPDEPRWTLPGGGAELEESIIETAVREVREETGYDVALDGVLWVSTRVVPAAHRFADTTRPLKAVRVVFAAHVVGGTLRPEVGGSTDEARWVPVADVPGLPHVSLVDEALVHLRGALGPQAAPTDPPTVPA